MNEIRLMGLNDKFSHVFYYLLFTFYFLYFPYRRILRRICMAGLQTQRGSP